MIPFHNLFIKFIYIYRDVTMNESCLYVLFVSLCSGIIRIFYFTRLFFIFSQSFIVFLPSATYSIKYTRK